MKRGLDLIDILIIVAVLAAFGFLLFSRDSSGRVAVVNTEDIYRRLDRDLQIRNELGRFGTNLQAQLQTESDALQKQFEALQQEYGDSPTQEQTDALSELENKLNAQRQKELSEVGDQFDAHRQRLVQAFLDEVGVVAQQVAADRGAQIVLSKAPSCLSVDPSADITEDVLSKMRPWIPGPAAAGNVGQSKPSPSAPDSSMTQPAQSN